MLRQTAWAALSRGRTCTSRRLYSAPKPQKVETDDLAIPLTPTWSVHALLSSYPSPQLSSATLKKLYKLSALEGPAVGTPEYDKVKNELEEMIRMVEAVKLVDTTAVTSTDRYAAIGVEEDADRKLYGNPDVQRDQIKQGTQLLEHAARTEGHFYVVETDRTRTPSL